jgi:hypothetical protein
MAAKKKAASRPGAYQLRKGAKIRNMNDDDDYVTQEIRKRAARAKARRAKKTPRKK